MQITVEAPAGFEGLPAEQQKRIEASFRKTLARKTLAELLRNSDGAKGYSEAEQLRLVEAERQKIWDEQHES